MTPDRVAVIQRHIAAEFESRGWEYDLLVGRALAEAIAREAHPDPSTLTKSVSKEFLVRNRIRREDVRDAIGTVLIQIDDVTSKPETPSMKILFVSADPADQARLRLDAEHRDIQSRIRSSTGRDQVTLESALATRPRDLIDELNRHRPTILHLAGHGGPTGIAMEDESGKTADLTTDQLVRLVQSAPPGLKLVVLNTCESSHQAKPIAAHVDASIGMTQAIGDEAAREFSAQLYSSLAEGVPLDVAFEQAKLQINLSGLSEDQTPALFVGSGGPSELVFVAR